MNNYKYELDRTTIFKKDLKKAKKRGCDMKLLDEIVEKLLCGEPLPEKNKDHELTGNWKGHRECHITPDWLLVYRIIEKTLILSLVRTGSHSDLDF
ncbi:MAG: type II toxin-antitoxin system YafQ family toxin [Ruminococcus sp.]|nr:type II toxin-antitoxin system YafQ family toxin [Ruminococcus sp.]MDE6672431.1 type II toxin-antitoxin system YafQ family toxin [Ruminococcus sp.]